MTISMQKALEFYDESSLCFRRIVTTVSSQEDRELLLNQMASALAAEIVAMAPERAETIWRGAGADVRLRPHPAARAVAHGSRRGFQPLLTMRECWRGETAACALMVVGLFVAALSGLALIWGQG